MQIGATPDPHQFFRACLQLCGSGTVCLLAVEKRQQGTYDAFISCAHTHFRKVRRHVHVLHPYCSCQDSRIVVTCSNAYTPGFVARQVRACLHSYLPCMHAGSTATASHGDPHSGESTRGAVVVDHKVNLFAKYNEILSTTVIERDDLEVNAAFGQP